MNLHFAPICGNGIHGGEPTNAPSIQLSSVAGCDHSWPFTYIQSMAELVKATPGYSLAMAIAIQVVKVDRQYEWSLGE